MSQQYQFFLAATVCSKRGVYEYDNSRRLHRLAVSCDSRRPREVFKTAFEGFAGAEYNPLAFATQVVAGTKYAFLAEGHIVIPDEPKLVAVIHIIKPLQGKPTSWKSSRFLLPIDSTSVPLIGGAVEEMSGNPGTRRESRGGF